VAVQLGWLDTNLFIHALYAGDREHARSCGLLNALADGRAEGWLSPLVLRQLPFPEGSGLSLAASTVPVAETIGWLTAAPR
jgi:hypothetical protein